MASELFRSGDGGSGRRGRRVASRILVALTVTALVLPGLPSAAAAQEDPATEIVHGLRAWANAFGGIAQLDELATPLPGTDTPLRDVLAIDRVLGMNLEAAFLDRPLSVGVLPGLIDDAEGFSNAAVTQVSGGPIEISFDVSVTRTVPLPLAYDDDILAFTGAVDGGLTGTFAASFAFEYDETDPVAALRFVQVNEPEVSLVVGTTTTGDNAAATGVDGWTDVALGGPYALDWSMRVLMRDPEGRHRIAEEDFLYTSPGDLFRLADVPVGENPDVTLQLNLAESVPGILTGRAGTVGLGTEPSALFPPIVVTPGADLQRLRGVTPSQGLLSFGQAVAALLSAQQTVDVDLPLLDGSLADLYGPASRLGELLEQMGRAEFACGATNTLPPEGRPVPGGDWYCNATVSGATGPVTWAAVGGTVDPDTVTAATVASSPTKNVRIEGVGGVPRLTVTYKDAKGAIRTARTVINTAQELSARMEGAGFDGTIGYDAGADTLTLGMSEALAATKVSVAPGDASTLGPTMGLRALRAAPGGATQADVDLGSRAFAANLGISLDTAATDRTFLQVPDGRLLEIDSLEVGLPGVRTLALTGRVGFLGVDVAVTALELSSSGASAVTVDVPVTTRSFGAHDPVEDVVAVTDLVSGEAGGQPAAVPQGSVALSAAATVTVTPQPLPDGTAFLSDASGSATITWANLLAGALPEAVAGDGWARLRLLDLVPSVFGTAGGPASGATTTLVDPQAHFLADFGVAAGDPAGDRHFGSTLYNLDQHASCTGFTVESATTVTCDGALVGWAAGTTPTFAAGDRYLVDGDPFALRDRVLGSLIAESAILESLTGPEHTGSLPAIDVHPDDLAPERDALVGYLGGIADAAVDPDDTSASTLQQLVATLAARPLVTGVTVDVASRDGDTWLDVSTSAATVGKRLNRPLLIRQGESVLVSEPGTTVSVSTTSTTTLAIGVDLSDGHVEALHEMGTRSRAGVGDVDGINPASSLATAALQLGGASVQVSGGAGDAVVRLDVDVDTGIASDTPLPDLAGGAGVTTVRTGPLVRPTPDTRNECAVGTEKPLLNDVCARIIVVGADNVPVVIAYSAEATQTGPGADPDEYPSDGQPIAVRFAADGLGYLADALDRALDGNATGTKAILVGADLDGGAEIPAAVRTYATTLRGLLAAIPVDGTTTVDALVTAITTALTSAAATTPVGYSGTPAVEASCKGSCADKLATDVTEIEITGLTLTADAGTSVDLPFDTGLANLPLRSNGTVEAVTTPWRLPVEFGINRTAGPFVGFGAGDAASIAVTVDGLPTGTCHEASLAAPIFKDSEGTLLGGRCLDAVMGVFPATLRDWQGSDPAAPDAATGLDLTTTVNLPAERFGLGRLAAGDLELTPTLSGHGLLAAQFETWAHDAKLYDVAGTVRLAWNPSTYTKTGYGDAVYAHAVLDMGTFQAMLGRMTKEVDAWLKPIRPVVDTLRRPIPVLSNLSQMTGGEALTLLSLLGGQYGAASVVALVELVARFSDFVKGTQNPDAPGVKLISLGDGGVYDRAGSLELGGFTIPIDALIPISSCDEYRGGVKAKCDPKPGAKSKDGKTPKTTDQKAAKGLSHKVTYGVKLTIPSITTPILDDAQQTYDMLLGKADGVLLRADFGTISAFFNYQATYGPMMIGPVPTEVFFAGNVKLNGRLSMGFDTYAASLAVGQLTDPGDPDELVTRLKEIDGDAALAGFFLDDLDGKGNDVPEMQVVVAISAGAAVSIKIFKVGVEGGVEIEINLDARDPNGDGKLRRDEMAGGSKYDCAFDSSGLLRFFLNAVLGIKLPWPIGTLTYRYRIVNSPPITLFANSCTTTTAALARTDTDRNGDGLVDLWLQMTDKADQFVVRQMSPSTGATITFHVEALGREESFEVPKGAVVYARAGAGDDVVRLEPGEQFLTANGVTAVIPVPFTTAADIEGGTGDDSIVTAGGADRVLGNEGEDTITLGAGDDRAWGDDKAPDPSEDGATTVAGDHGANNDSIDGGLGDDRLHGGLGSDQLQGGPGVDRLWGDAGNDRLVGGPALDPTALMPFTDPGRIAPLLDGGDLLIGGAGSDDLDGARGTDTLDGGAGPANANTVGMTTREITVEAMIIGGTTTVKVQLPSIAAPDAAAQAVLCASGPLAATAERDVLVGGPDPDYLFGGNGDDAIDGGGGDDLLCGRNGDDELIGDGSATDPGIDEIHGGVGRDRVYAGAGDDSIYGDANADSIDGGAGADAIHGGPDADIIAGGDGADAILGEGTTEAVDASLVTPDVVSAGDDQVESCAATVLVVAGRFDTDEDLTTTGVTAGTPDTGDTGLVAGYRVLAGRLLATGTQPAGSPRYLDGLVGNYPVTDGRLDLDGDGEITSSDTRLLELPVMRSTSADGDCILGGAGDDGIDGGAGGDWLAGGDGADFLTGGLGNDFVRGNAGDDLIAGGDGADFLVGDAGDDSLQGNVGDDRLRGMEGADVLIGGSAVAGAADGEDALFGGRGDDILVAENAVVRPVAPGDAESGIPGTYLELLAGPSGTARDPADATDPWWDELYGGFGNDWVFGSPGDDLVRGGQDQDYVEGGVGGDTIYGDDGSDLVVGGGSSADGTFTLARQGGGLPDGRDTIYGDMGADGTDAADVIAGDNARLGWAAGGLPTTAAGAVDALLANARVTLFDVATTTAAAAAGTSGGDTINAGGGGDLVFGQGADDVISGGPDDDLVEGNAGSDRITGGAGNDRLIGGGSAADGVIDADRTGAGLIDGRDTLIGDDSATGVTRSGDGHDVLVGDNGRIDPAGWLRPGTGDTFPAIPLSTLTMADTAPGPVAGTDLLAGDGGWDVLVGGFDDGSRLVSANEACFGAVFVAGGDVLCGNAGDDVLLGDQGTVTWRRASELGPQRTVTANGLRNTAPVVFAAGTVVPTVTLTGITAGGMDILAGGGGDDRLHGGAGDDMLTGDDGTDALFGGAGLDALWGGLGQDHLFGGTDADWLDVKPRAARDPAAWLVVAPLVDRDGARAPTNGVDLEYGGWGQDALQADDSPKGQPGDRLLDWVGSYNVYYVCTGAYGAETIIRSHTASVVDLLRAVAASDGAVDVTLAGSSGFTELGLVLSGDYNSNNSPIHPDSPGHFTCE